MIGEAHLTAEQLAQVGDRADVRVGRGCRIGAGALEQHEIVATGFTRRSDGLIQIRQAGHTGGNDQRFTSGCTTADQRQMVVLEAGDLVSRNVKILKKIDRTLIKW